MATATTRAETSSIPTRKPTPQGLFPPMSPDLVPDAGGGVSSPCLLRAALSLSSKEGSSSPGSSLMSAPGRQPRRKAGACYRGVLTVSRMQPPRGSGVSGALRGRRRAGGGFVRNHRRDHVAAVGFHGGVDQHLEENVALRVAAPQQADLRLARRQ